MDNYFEVTNWFWGLSLIVATMSIHATRMVMMALGMVGIRVRLVERGLRR